MGRFILALLVLANVTHAEGTRGGGDDMGLEFQGLLNAALDEIKTGSPDLQKQVAPLGLDTLYGTGGARALITDDAQTVTVDGVQQDGVAVSDSATNLTMVNRARWKGIVSTHVKEGIALHEALVLKKVESTGQYPISGKFLARFGLETGSLISGNPLPVTTKNHVLTIDCTPTKFWRADAGDDVKKLYLVFDGQKGLQDPVLVLTFNTGIGLPAMGGGIQYASLDSDTPGKIEFQVGDIVPEDNGIIALAPTSVARVTFDFKALTLGATGHGVAEEPAQAQRGFSVNRPSHTLNCKITDQPPTK